MIHRPGIDPLAGLGVALAVCACGPRVAPEGPGAAPTETPIESPTAAAFPASSASGGREIVVGEMCPDRAAGRPAVSLVAARRSLAWTTEEEELAGLVSRGRVPMFTVFGHRGERVGLLTVAGPVDLAGAGPVALGGYAGGSPCADEATATDCQRLLGGCGLAVAAIGADDPVTARGGGACVTAAGTLLVDVNGDGAYEAFQVADFAEGSLREPADEVFGKPSSAVCEGRFAVPGVLPGGDDPKGWRGLDLVGVLDVDEDGRRELILQYRYGDRRTWAIYAAGAYALTLNLVAEGQPWTG